MSINFNFEKSLTNLEQTKAFSQKYISNFKKVIESSDIGFVSTLTKKELLEDAKNIHQKFYPLLKKHLLLNHLPQRISTYFKFLILGKFKKAKKTFTNLPFKIQFYECFIYAPLYKFRNHQLNKINKFYRLKVINLIKENL